MKFGVFFFSLLLLGTTAVAGTATETIIHCGLSDGTANTYFDIAQQKIWINRDENNLKTAVEMTTLNFAVGSSAFSLAAAANHPKLGTNMVFFYNMVAGADGSSGTLSLTVADTSKPDDQPAAAPSTTCGFLQ
jgi:hypothetical protein